MEQFNLERALAGEALVTRDGREVTGFTEIKSNGVRRPFGCKVAGFPFRVLEDGTHESGNKDLDLFMVKSVTAKVEPVLIPFDLQRALKGDKLITRDGRVATDFSEDEDGDYMAKVDMARVFYNSEGAHLHNNSGLDLFMAEAADNKLKVGDWVKCVKTMRPPYSQTAFAKDGYFEVAEIDNGYVHLMLRGNQYAIPHEDVSTFFDLTAPLSYDPAPPAKPENVPAEACYFLKMGDWLKCVCDFKPALMKEPLFLSGRYYPVYAASRAIGVGMTGENGVGYTFVPGSNFSGYFNRFHVHSENPLHTAGAVPPIPPKSILQEAADLIYGDRQADYGSVTTNFTNIAKGWSVIFNHEVSPEQVGLAMAWVKIARECNKPKRDNLVDIAGYIGCIDKLQRGE